MEDRRERVDVERSYDAIASFYLASKDPSDTLTLRFLREFSEALPAGASVIDLGCGAGEPSFPILGSSFNLTGVDLSSAQLALAAERASEAKLIKADMAEVEFPPSSFDGVLALYSIIHVPREQHSCLLRRIYTWLRPGGVFLATWPISEWEGTEENWEGWGAPMSWSHFGAEENLRMLLDAGFGIEWSELAKGRETWLWVMARRKP